MIKTFNNNIYIVMYHYVREIKNSNYPNLKGLEFNQFKKQIDYFKNNFNILNNDNFSDILVNKKIPNKKSILLTFDDGYKDHYSYVFPYLYEKKISAIFYPPVQVVKNQYLLDVNKIHFVLEKENDRKKILDEIDKCLFSLIKKNLADLEINSINLNSRYDDKETILIKSLLQYFLPLKIREKIINQLFKLFVCADEKYFAETLYMNQNEIQEMYKNSMTFGSHGNYHYWFEYLSKKKQIAEIDESIKFFKDLGVFCENFSVCYPYGSYNATTLEILEKFNVRFGLTTKVGEVNSKNIVQKFALPRYDTNDFAI